MEMNDEFIERLLEPLLPRSVNRFILRIEKESLQRRLNQVLARQQSTDDPYVVLEDLEEWLEEPKLISEYLVSYDYFIDKLKVEYIPTSSHIERALEIYEENTVPALKKRLSGLKPYSFEDLIMEILDRLDWIRNIQITNRSRDGGIDFTGVYVGADSGLKLSLIGEVKCWKNPVGVKTVREFMGVLAQLGKHQRNIGIYISASGFTEPAKREIDRSSKRILTFVAEDLIEMMVEHKIGVREFKIRGNVIDEQFWRELEHE